MVAHHSPRTHMLSSCPAPVPTIQNIVATFDVGDLGMNLDAVVMRVPFADYNAKRFAAVIMKLRAPATTCLLFSSGKVVCTGARSESECQRAAIRLVSLLCRYGVPVSYTDFKIQNIVVAAYCPFFVDLNRLCAQLEGNCSYDTSLFPGEIMCLAFLSWCRLDPSRLCTQQDGDTVFLDREVYRDGRTRPGAGAYDMGIVLLDTCGDVFHDS